MKSLLQFVWLWLMVLVPSAWGQFQENHAVLWSNEGMQDLGTLPGWQNSYAEAINQFGRVVGLDGEDDNSLSTSFGWSASFGMRFLNGLSLAGSEAVGINDADQVAGTNLITNGSLHAFIWTRKSGVQDLGDLGSGTSSATGINNSGQVVGASPATLTGPNHPFLWSQATGMQDLATVGQSSCPTCSGIAWAINESGVIAGEFAPNSGGITYAGVWRNGRLRSLGDLGGSGRNRGSAAYGINRYGQVVGGAFTPDGSFHAFLWTERSGMRDLGTLPGYNTSYALGINSAGQVVGWVTDGSHTLAFSWTASGGMQGLGSFGGIGSRATAVNDLGQVTGFSTIP